MRRLLRRRSLLGRVEDEGFEGEVDSMGALEFADIEEGEADCLIVSDGSWPDLDRRRRYLNSAPSLDP